MSENLRPKILRPKYYRPKIFAGNVSKNLASSKNLFACKSDLNTLLFPLQFNCFQNDPAKHRHQINNGSFVWWLRCANYVRFITEKIIAKFILFIHMFS